jgi:hypothetical protein
MKIYRYICQYASKKTYGIIAAGFDYARLEKLYNWDVDYSFEKVLELNQNTLGWLKDPELSGEYWFTELGNELFKKKALQHIINRLPRKPAKAIYCHKIDLDDIPNWESLVKYSDDHQLVF